MTVRRSMLMLAAFAALAATPALAADQVPAAVPAPPPGQGQVVFFRPGAFVGSAISSRHSTTWLYAGMTAAFGAVVVGLKVVLGH